MPRHPPDTLSSLTTFIDHRHDPSGEELALGEVTSGRAGNGTNDQQKVTCGNACFAGTRPIAKKVLDDSHPRKDDRGDHDQQRVESRRKPEADALQAFRPWRFALVTLNL